MIIQRTQTLISSTATRPVMRAVVVAMAGMIFPAINLLWKKKKIFKSMYLSSDKFSPYMPHFFLFWDSHITIFFISQKIDTSFTHMNAKIWVLCPNGQIVFWKRSFNIFIYVFIYFKNIFECFFATMTGPLLLVSINWFHGVLLKSAIFLPYNGSLIT